MGEGKAKIGVLAHANGPVLRIVFEGSTPGLPEERLSIAAFARPLALLLKAYRRIASGLVRDALDKKDYGRRGGRYADQVSTFDLELSALTHKSPLALEFQCTARVPSNAQLALFDDGLLGTAAGVLLDAIQAESTGHLRQSAVRHYLQALPEGLERQHYILTGPGGSREVNVDSVHLGEIQPNLPSLVRFVGVVAGVGFRPGPEEVRLQNDAGQKLTASATGKQVERALELRDQPVTALLLRGPTGDRLLWLKTSSELDQQQWDHREAVERLAKQWDGVLRRLAE